MGTLAAALTAARFQAAVDATIPPRLIQATAIAAVGGATLPRPVRAAAIPAAEVYTLAAVAATPMVATMLAEAITTADASGPVLTMAWGLASPSAGDTISVQAAVTMTAGATGILPHAMRTYTPVTNRTTASVARQVECRLCPRRVLRCSSPAGRPEATCLRVRVLNPRFANGLSGWLQERWMGVYCWRPRGQNDGNPGLSLA